MSLRDLQLTSTGARLHLVGCYCVFIVLGSRSAIAARCCKGDLRLAPTCACVSFCSARLSRIECRGVLNVRIRLVPCSPAWPAFPSPEVKNCNVLTRNVAVLPKFLVARMHFHRSARAIFPARPAFPSPDVKMRSRARKLAASREVVLPRARIHRSARAIFPARPAFPSLVVKMRVRSRARSPRRGSSLFARAHFHRSARSITPPGTLFRLRR